MRAGPPTGPGTLFQYFARKDKITPKQIAVELRVIIWFIDAQIAFNQLDNPLFRQVLRSAGVDQPSSRTTIINTFLPLIYSFALDEQRALLGRTLSFFNSFDVWTQRQRKFISLTYHFVDPKTFE